MEARFTPVGDHALLVSFATEVSEGAHQTVFALDKALAADPNYADAHAGLALVFLEEGKDRSARGSSWRALKQKWATPRAHLVLGMGATNAGKMDEAKKHYNNFLKFESKGPQANEIRQILKSLP